MDEGTQQLVIGFGAMVVLLLGFTLGYLQNKVTRAKFLRRMRRDDTGLLRYKTRSHRLVTAIVHLDNPTYKVNDKMFIKDKISEGITVYDDEVPTVYYTESDARPIRLSDGIASAEQKQPEIIDLDKATPNKIIAQSQGKDGLLRYELSLDPTGLLAAFFSYDQAKEAELRAKLGKSKMELKDFAMIGLLIIIGYLVYTQGDQFEAIKKSLEVIGEGVKALAPKVV